MWKIAPNTPYLFASYGPVQASSFETLSLLTKLEPNLWNDGAEGCCTNAWERCFPGAGVDRLPGAFVRVACTSPSGSPAVLLSVAILEI